jgi:carbon storage regulator
MLVLTRKQGEQIRIGDNVLITVVRTKGKGVRLGIQAPAHVPVLRGEIAQAISDETSDQAKEQTDSQPARHDDESWPLGGEYFQAAAANDREASAGDMLGSRGGRGLLRQMVAARGE